MTLEIQVLTTDRHKDVAELNCALGSQLLLLLWQLLRLLLFLSQPSMEVLRPRGHLTCSQQIISLIGHRSDEYINPSKQNCHVCVKRSLITQIH
jgi:hypothetical protein